MLLWQAHKGKIESVAFSPDGQLLATSTGSTHAPYLWEPTTGALVRRLEGASSVVKSLAFAPDAPFFAAGSAQGIVVWRTDTWEVLSELNLDWAYDLAFGPGPAPMLVAGGKEHVLRWIDASAPGGSQPRRSDGSFQAPRNTAALHISPDGTLLATSTMPAAEVWRTADYTRVRTLRSTKTNSRGSVRFSPDGRRVAISYGKWVETWSLAEGTSPLLKIAAGVGRSALIWTVNWTADGKSLLTAGNDGRVRVWDAFTGAELKAFDWKIGRLYCAAFSPDGLTCAACGEKGQVVVWDVDS